ncbi:kinase-like domain-containing protein, partial [Tribonema minus]
MFHSAACESLTPGASAGRWKISECIARGSFGGSVHIALDQRNGQLAAVKLVPLLLRQRSDRDGGGGGGAARALFHEAALMRQLHHPNIVGFLSVEIRNAHMCIFQELVPGGSVAALLQRFGALPEAMARCYARQALAGIEYLHKCRIAHRDLKASNMLVDAHSVLKLADFGTSVLLPDSSSLDSHSVSLTARTCAIPASGAVHGTPYFMAPEMLQRQAHGLAVDTWGFGGALLQMVSGAPPWSGAGVKSPAALLRHMRARDGAPPPLPPRASPPLRALLRACFRWDAAARPTAQQLRRHEFFCGGDSGADRCATAA